MRDNDSSSRFPRILGNSVNDFKKHIEMFFEKYSLMTPNNAVDYSYGDFSLGQNQTGLLLTFDDGLSDHFLTAKILADNGINAIFFIPTCILNGVPANPIIIHYCIAIHGLSNFLSEYEILLKQHLENHKPYMITFSPDKDNPFEVIKKIKTIFKYSLDPKLSRKILLEIYENLLKEKFDEPMRFMHLTSEQISEMVEMGHSIGTHTHSHISVASSNLTETEFYNEIVEPKNLLKSKLGISTNFMSYPFGELRDCLSSKELIMKTNTYKLVFTVEEILNTPNTSPYELGRLMPMSTDTSESLYLKMKNIAMRID